MNKDYFKGSFLVTRSNCLQRVDQYLPYMVSAGIALSISFPYRAMQLMLESINAI